MNLSLSKIIRFAVIFLLGLIFISLITSFITMRGAKTTADNLNTTIIPLMLNSVKAAETLGGLRINTMSYVFDNTDNSYNTAVNYYNQFASTSKDMLAITQARDKMGDTAKTVDSIINDIDEYKSHLEKSRDNLKQINNYVSSMKKISTDLIDSVINYTNQIISVQNVIASNRNPIYKEYMEQSNDMQTYMLNFELSALELLTISLKSYASRNPNALNSRETDDVIASYKKALNQISTKQSEFINSINKNRIYGSLPQIPRVTTLKEEIYGNTLIQLANQNLDLVLSLKAVLMDLQTQTISRNQLGPIVNNNFLSLNSSVAKNSSDESANLLSMISKASATVIVFAFLIIVAGVAIILILKKTVIEKLMEFVDLTANLTEGDGDLTKRMPVTSTNEIGQLAGFFNKFIENIYRIIKEVKESADDVSAGNNELAATVEQLSSNFSSQSEQVSSVAVSMESIREISQEVVKDLSNNMNDMKDTNSNVDLGSKQLKDVMSTVTDIKKQTEKLSTTIQSLANSSSKIGEILLVINDIADQTNLLALNAAIEAARAGDAGRGFAVVADEVRKLAERTQRSTSEIDAIITSLQSESAAASVEMSNANSSVNSGIESINKADSMFNNVVLSVHAISSTTENANTAVSDQFKQIESVNDNTRGIASGVEESAHAITEVVSTVSHLQKRAERLKIIVEQFKI